MNESKQTELLNNFTAAGIGDKYADANNRLLLLDYDGTLSPLMPLPELAAPTKSLLELLHRLAQDPRNTVYIISGREYTTLGEWLGHLPLNLVAEHGAWMKPAGSDWNTAAHLASNWIAPVKDVFENYSSKCEGAFVELKSYSIAWHYRNAPPESVANLFDRLITELQGLASQLPISIIEGNKVVEVKNKSVNKGTAVEMILKGRTFDFILACGDDTTDEDMFGQLAETENACTVKVGEGETSAKLNVSGPAAISQLLQQFVD